MRVWKEQLDPLKGWCELTIRSQLFLMAGIAIYKGKAAIELLRSESNLRMLSGGIIYYLSSKGEGIVLNKMSFCAEFL